MQRGPIDFLMIYVDVFQVVSFHMNIYTNLSQDFEIMSTW